MKTKEKKNFNEKNAKKVKRSISIITVFLWVFLVATMVTIIAGNVRNTNAYGSESVQVGTGGNNIWNEIVMYHACYPNSAGPVLSVNYSIRLYSTKCSFNPKSFADCGFTRPIGYSVKSSWYDSPSGGNPVSKLEFDKNNAYKTTHLYAQYDVHSSQGSESVKIEIGGSNIWNETIIYHANYPNSSDETWKVDYNIRNFTIICNSNIKSYDEIGFTVPSGYKLKSGWYDSSSGGKRVAVSNFPFNKNNAGKTTHLYAQYEKIGDDSSNVILNYYDRDTLYSEKKYAVGDTAKIITCDVKRDKYEFLGWSDNIDSNEVVYKEGNTITLLSNKSLYAVWKPLDYIVIEAKKLWEDENNKYGKRPENVVLQIKNGEEVVSEISVSEENNWSYEFEVPKYDEEGNEIEYTVDEKETDVNYEKRIDGYKVINKYIEEEINENKENTENNNDIMKNEENVDTSDINIWMYVGIVIVSIVVIVVVIILIKKNNKKSK